MTQIEELQARITRALDRIAQGVEHLTTAPPPVEEAPPPEASAEQQVAPVPDAGELAELRAALEDEKMANAQLEERVRVLHARLEEQDASLPDAALQEQLAAQRDSLAVLDDELQRLRTASDMLRKTNREMREALEGNVGEPHLINQAMLAELETLRAERAAESAEAQAVLKSIEPMLEPAAGEEAH